MTKAELLADLAAKVQNVGENRLISTDAIANVRVYDVDVYVTIDANGTETLVQQRIHVHHESSPEESAAYAGRLRANYTPPETPVNGNKLVFETLNQMVADNAIKSYSFSHTAELGGGTKAGVFTLVENDDAETQKAFSVIEGQVITANYKKIV